MARGNYIRSNDNELNRQLRENKYTGFEGCIVAYTLMNLGRLYIIELVMAGLDHKHPSYGMFGPRTRAHLQMS